MVEMPEDIQIGDLVVTKIERYFDESGSYMDHFQATANRQPTHSEMKMLADQYKVVCVTSCEHESYSMPSGVASDPAMMIWGLVFWGIVAVLVFGFFALIYFGFNCAIDIYCLTQMR